MTCFTHRYNSASYVTKTIGRNLYYKDNIALKMYSRISSNLFSILSNMIIITHVKYLITLGTYIDDNYDENDDDDILIFWA